VLDSRRSPTDFVQDHARSHLYLRFDDIEQAQAHREPPNAASIRQALEFAKGRDRLLITCRAGQGRSVALAYLIGCQHRGVTEALRLLDATRHRPNRLVVALGDTLLGDPGILDRFDEWRNRHAHIQLSDYYEQLEKDLDALEARGARDRITGA
jgi:predicted protein tyrosine phosphatase